MCVGKVPTKIIHDGGSALKAREERLCKAQQPLLSTECVQTMVSCIREMGQRDDARFSPSTEITYVVLTGWKQRCTQSKIINRRILLQDRLWPTVKMEVSI